jgi:two-component system phosphate regulon sensor histidine kinase PhoR
LILVTRRSVVLANWIGMGGAILFGIVALLIAPSPGNSDVAWAYGLGALLLATTWIFIQGVFRDTRDTIALKQAEVDVLRDRFAQQRESVDELADGLDVAVFVCDAHGSILYSNRRARELFRFDDPLGRSLLAVTLSYDLEQLVIRAAATGEAAYAELGFSYPVERIGLAKAWISTPGAGRVFLSVYDVTDLRRLERVRKDFVANVSHELRTPMTLIRAMAETLQEEARPEDELAQRYFAQIIREVDRLASISQDLLTLSNAESTAVRKQPCDLAAIVRRTVDDLQERATEKGLTLTYQGPESLEIQANPGQMDQVAINLIANALNYTAAGKVEATIREEGGQAIFEVADTGIGIAIEHQPRVFERFYRVDKARSRTSGGTGLGLSIVKNIVEAHGGSVSLRSQLNAGSTFTVKVPSGEASPPELSPANRR